MLRYLGYIFVLFVHGWAQAATFIVTSAADTAGSTCTSTCTLRQAIIAANATTTADTINFNITLPVRGEILISPGSPLPTITQPLTINGYSQSGTRMNDDPVLSNAQLRIRIDGVSAGNVDGLAICASNVTIRGLTITRFGQRGIGVGTDNGGLLCAASLVAIHGNFLGMTNAGVLAANNSPVFISASTTIGSINVQDRNVLIGGNTTINSGQSSILGNLLNIDRNGLAISSSPSLFLSGSVNTQVIGSLVAPNRIACSSASIILNGALANNLLNANHFIPAGSSNTCQPIDLGNDGITANDLNDLDSGPNNLQNFPVITAAARIAGGLSLSGNLDVGHAGSFSYEIALYASSNCSANGHGPGERLLGITSRSFSSTAEGFSFTQLTSDALAPGTVITATATRAGVGTSEMSACFTLDPLPLVVNSTNDVADGACNATHCSLREAIIAANNFSGTGQQRIHFAVAPLSGTSEILIQPTTRLPDITKTVTIDGYSQPGTTGNTDPLVSNAVLRVRLDGSANNIIAGLTLCTSGALVRGLAITGFFDGIFGCDGAAITVVGNFLGLRSDGITAGNNNISARSSNAFSRFGGQALADRNVIANSNIGVLINGATSAGTQVIGNLFGTDRSGTLSRPNVDSIRLNANAQGVLIGGLGAPNRFRASSNAIALTASAGVGNTLAFNSFANQSSIAIDLSGNGVTLNDPGDNDTGPNELLNFPELTLAERNPSGLRLVGSVSRQPTTLVAYASAGCHANGHGEGEILLGVATLTGLSFDLQINTEADLIAFPVITATATFNNSTSEFSQCISATDAPPGIAVDDAADTAANGGCEVTGDSNSCTLREAITLANAQAGNDVIRFAIPGDGPHVISLSSNLPVITGGLLIDGYTEQGALPNAAPQGSDAVLKIELRGGTAALNVLGVCSAELVEIRGLALNGGAQSLIATGASATGACAVAPSNLTVRGNWLGLSADGAALTSPIGIVNRNARLTLGGILPNDRNVLANLVTGVLIRDSSSANSVVRNNLFGLSPELLASAAFENTKDVEITNVSNVTIGGEGALANSFNHSPVAILVAGTGSGNNTLYGNTFANHSGATAIDLTDTSAPNGINPNDINDVDTGANEGQNTPVLSDGSASANSITLNGTLDVPIGISSALNYRLAFYRSPSCNDTTLGREGLVYLGSRLQGFTSSSENFSVTLSVPPGGGFITATATSPTGSTSEFSNCLVAPQQEAIFSNGFED